MMDTARTCRQQAATSHAQALDEPLDSRRAILAASAAAWNQRAETLERVDRLTLQQASASPASS